MSAGIHDTEVIIIGGGPAGATLGCLIATGHHTALIIERAAHPREHVGELLTPSVNTILHRIGLLEQMDATGFVRRESVSWTMPRQKGVHPLTIPVAQYPPPRALRRYGYNVERDCFDALLLERARACGAEVLERTAVRRVLFAHDRAVGVEVQDEIGRTRAITGSFVIDASGRRCLLGTQLKLVHRRPELKQCALYTWFRDVEPLSPGEYGHTVLHLLDHHHAWGWQIPLRGGLTSIGAVAECARFQGMAEDKDAFFMRLIAKSHALSQTLAAAQRVRPWRTVSDYSYRLCRLSGKGWALVGDAAGFIDPIFSSGADIAMHAAVFAYESLLPLFLLGQWSDADEQFARLTYEDRLRQGMDVWAHAVDMFYHSNRDVRWLARQAQNLPAMARFLQGNPYALQNQIIFQGMLRAIAEHGRG
jgi:1H-pyrrole-2-carbonyl-[peptidyl-carrier protein] chlorinase